MRKHLLDLSSHITSARHRPGHHIMSCQVSRPDDIDDNTPSQPVILTDDADTALGEGTQRSCFNCSIIHTSAWRRSALYPGKVVGTQFLFTCSSVITTPTALQ